MSTELRSGYTILHLGNTQDSDPLADNTTRDISAEDLRNALADLRDSAAFRKNDPYVRYVVPANVGGTANAISITLTNDYPTSYTNAIPIRFQAQSDSSGDVSIEINSIGFVGLYKENQTRVGANDIEALVFYECVYSADADGSGTEGFTLYEGFGGTSLTIREPIEVTGTTYTVTEPGVYVFTGSSACAVTLATEDSTMFEESKWINAGTADCTFNATGTIINSDPFIIYTGTSYHFQYTGITGAEWAFT